MLTLSDIFFGVNIFNGCIRFIWLNPTYIMTNFIATYCKFTMSLVKHCVIKNDPEMEFCICMQSYHCARLLSLAFKSLSSILAVVVSSFTIFGDHIWINLRLLQLTSLFLIHRIFIGRNIARPNVNCPGI